MQDINTEVALLKKEVKDIKFIFNRLDTAIEKITEVSTSVNRMLAVHEEKFLNKKKLLQKLTLNLVLILKNYILVLLQIIKNLQTRWQKTTKKQKLMFNN